MPSLYTHCLLGEKVFDKISEGKVKNAISITDTLYTIGTNGPDIFFFYHAWPWLHNERAKIVNGYGEKMHASHINDMFKVMLEMCDKENNPFYIAYTAGVLIHWSLDHIAHPYVFNQTGDCKGKSSLIHRMYESHIDREMIKEFGIDIRLRRPYSFVAYKTTTYLPIYDLYSKVLKEVWDIELRESEMSTCVKDFYRIERALYDTSGSKMKWIGKLEGTLNLKGYGTSMVIPMEGYKGWDVLNRQKRNWRHPSTGEVKNSSFLEMFEEATITGTKLLTMMEDYLNDKISVDSILDYLGNRNFHSGLLEDNFQYFDLVEDIV